MDDAQWLFQQDAKEKKITARSARNKKRHTGCKLPTDYRSKKEIREMNGEVMTMNVNKRMTYGYFKMLSKDLQTEYLSALVDRYCVTTEKVAKMMGTTKSALAAYMFKKEIRIKWPSNPKHVKYFKEQEWEAFCNGEEFVEIPENKEEAPAEVVEEPAVVDEPEVPREAPVAPMEVLQHVEPEIVLAEVDRGPVNGPTIDEIALYEPFEVQTINVTLRDIRSWEGLLAALRGFPLPASNSVTINVHAITEHNPSDDPWAKDFPKRR